MHLDRAVGLAWRLLRPLTTNDRFRRRDRAEVLLGHLPYFVRAESPATTRIALFGA